MDVRQLVHEQNGFSKRRLAYTLAAGAASIGICESNAEAVISYSGIQNLSIGQGNSQDLNLDGDGNNDIRLKNYAYTNGINYQGATVRFFPGQIVGFQTNNLYYVKALHAGDSIDASTVGPTFYGSMALGNATVNQNPNAQFTNVQNAYIGLDFRINQRFRPLLRLGSCDRQQRYRNIHSWRLGIPSDARCRHSCRRYRRGTRARRL